jgi:hypothetical protein
MAAHDLLGLDLRSPIAYRGIENPPLAGIPLDGNVTLPCPDGKVRILAVGLDLAEGEQELFVFDATELVAFDPDEGPRLSPGPDALPAARFYGRSVDGSEGGASGGGCRGCSAPCGAVSGASDGAAPRETAATTIAGPERLLPAGRYLFMQWRPRDAAELAEGIEWFARECWWEGNRGRGPYFVRRIKEDGKLATQILRKE